MEHQTIRSPENAREARVRAYTEIRKSFIVALSESAPHGEEDLVASVESKMTLNHRRVYDKIVRKVAHAVWRSYENASTLVHESTESILAVTLRNPPRAVSGHSWFGPLLFVDIHDPAEFRRLTATHSDLSAVYLQDSAYYYLESASLRGQVVLCNAPNTNLNDAVPDKVTRQIIQKHEYAHFVHRIIAAALCIDGTKQKTSIPSLFETNHTRPINEIVELVFRKSPLGFDVYSEIIAMLSGGTPLEQLDSILSNEYVIVYATNILFELDYAKSSFVSLEHRDTTYHELCIAVREEITKSVNRLQSAHAQGIAIDELIAYAEMTPMHHWGNLMKYSASKKDANYEPGVADSKNRAQRQSA